MIYLWGASGHAKVIIEILEAGSVTIGGLWDDNESIKTLIDYRVGRPLAAPFDPDKDEILLSIGNNHTRKHIVAQHPYRYATAFHPSAQISSRATIGEGSVVMPGVSINSSIQVGAHVILNTNCSVDHDCILEDYVHISPGASVAGDVCIGEGTHIGIGASIIQGVRIGKWCTIGAGSVIIKDIPDNATVVGNPGRIIKINK